MNLEDWEKIYWEYRLPVMNYCSQFCTSKDTAEDLTQEVFLKVQNRLDKIDSEKSIKSYLFKTTRNLCFNFLRNDLKHKKIEKFIWSKSFFYTSSKIDIQSSKASPLSDIIQSENSGSLLEQLDALPEDQREALLLRYQNKLSRQEISEILNVSLSKTKRLLLEGLKSLKQQMERTHE